MQTKQNRKIIHCFPSAGRYSAISKKAGSIRLFLGRQILSVQMFPYFSAVLFSRALYGTGYPFGHFGLAILVLLPYNILCTLSPLQAGQHEKQKSLQLCARTTQQQLKYRCIINTIFIKNPTLSII